MERSTEPEGTVLATPGLSTTGGGAQRIACAIVPSRGLVPTVETGVHLLGGLVRQCHKRLVVQEEAGNASAALASRLP